MPFKGTDLSAWDKAKKGKSSEEKSKIYYKEKAKNEKRSKTVVKDDPVPKFNFGLSPVDNQPYSIPDTVDTRSMNRKNSFPEAEDLVRKITKKRVEYVSTRLLLDDLRDYRSSKIISNISNGLATVFMKAIRSNEMTNNQMNFLRSSVAFVACEVINKSLKKPIEMINNVKMFIKIGKMVYRFIVWYNKITATFEIKEDSITEIGHNSVEFHNFLKEYPKIGDIYTKKTDAECLLGKIVDVIVDHPVGYKRSDNITYALNYGYIINYITNVTQRQYTYIIGQELSLIQFSGIVIAIIKKLDGTKDQFVVATLGEKYSEDDIRKWISFHETEFIIIV